MRHSENVGKQDEISHLSLTIHVEHMLSMPNTHPAEVQKASLNSLGALNPLAEGMQVPTA